MAVSLGIGTLATPQVEKLWGQAREFLKKNPAGYAIIALVLLGNIAAASRKNQVEDASKAKK
eukprot:CAMPEP_0176057530 /NCGR_PEP_ID=MMETSP0120_2-20121206/28655_1 /TAXON_ID=160619 /ORGANISM="Kryptoperidinium foliaceum, Strain CCMP 1326" /LENGTH=61 /DNA_ID=CAMNT_0017391043 /DNA_START=8 /DNA_END=193 /DNA_ORIENTATION=+